MQSKTSKIHVRLTEGRFQQLRRLISCPLLLAFFTLVWVQLDGQPLLLFDFPERRIIIFGYYFAWQDLYILSGFLIAAAALLFTLAMAWGRVWCGFACPQSIWTWLFLRIEQWAEGNSRTRAKNAHLPLRGKRLLRRINKHLGWLLLAAFTSLTFTGYFVPIRELVGQLINLEMSLVLLAWLGIMALLTYLNAGLVREQICLHACPYSRFQGVMMDDDTRKVSYDYVRGEPRGKQEAVQKSPAGCIDCTLCVQVCPTGIDIREGMQAGCIDCGACIDACDQVMDKIDQPKGLIRFASEKQLSGQTSSFWRPRLTGYLLICLLAMTGAVYGLTSKQDLTAEVRRERGELFRVQGNGQLCNFYHIKVEGFNPALTQVQVDLPDQPDLELAGPDVLPLDNRGDWVAYRICGQPPTERVEKIQLQFTAGSVVLNRQTTFIGPSNP